MKGRDIPSGRRILLRCMSVAAVAALSSAALVACASGGTEGEASSQTLRVALAGGSPGSTLDVHVLTDAFTNGFAQTFYESIGEFDANNEPSLLLAESLTSNEDATVWTLVLKDDITFNDGTPLTTDDVIFSYERIMDPSVGAVSAGNLAIVEEFVKLDDQTMEIRLNTPYVELPILLSGGSMGIVPAHYDPAHPVSTGPWVFESYEGGVVAHLTRYDGYHGEPAKLGQLDLMAIPDESARTNALIANQIDIDTYLAPVTADQLESDPNVQIIETQQGQFEVVNMRVDQGPFADPRLREAMKLAVDREQILSVVGGGRGRLAYDVYGIDNFGFREDLVRERDVERAKQLVIESGIGDHPITLYTVAGAQQTAQIVATNARDVGLNVSVEVKDDVVFYTEGYLEYDFSMDMWPSGSIIYLAGTMDGPDASINATHFSDEEYNEQFRIAASSFDADVRAAALSRMQEIIFERGGIIIPRFVSWLTGAQKNVQGLPLEDPRGTRLYKELKNVTFSG